MIREAKLKIYRQYYQSIMMQYCILQFIYTYDVQTLDERKAWFDMKNKANEPIFVFEQAGQGRWFCDLRSI